MTSTQKSDQEQPIAPESDAGAGAILTSHRRTQFFVILACILCFILFWQAGKWIGLPAQPGFGDSVLQQPYWLLALMAIYVLLPVAVAIGTLVAGRFWFFAGLFAGALGLTALSLRGGPMRYVLFHAADAGSTHRIFFQLALEQCLLFVPVGAIWLFFARGYEASLPKIESEKDKTPGNGTLLMSLATQFAFMVFCLVIFTPTDGKKQVLVSTFLAGFTGTAMAEWLVPDRKASAWYWMAPLAVGLLGYILASMNATNFTTGYAIGTFANLAHPLPLDYASSGIAGTLLGFWIGADRPELAMSIISGPMLGLVFRRRWVKTPQPSDGKN